MLSLFKKLNNLKGTGLDGISSRLIIDCADLAAPHVSITFNFSPQGIFKQGERSDINNYHPISVIWTIMGKVFERNTYNQLFANLSDHNILSKHQQLQPNY